MVRIYLQSRRCRVQSLGREDPLEEVMATHLTIITRKIHGQRSQMGYSPWDGKESDTTEVTEHACVHTHTHTHSSSNPAFSESLPHSSHSHPNSVTHPSSVFPHNSDRVLYQSDFHTAWQLSVSAKGTISYSRTGTPSFLFISQCPTLEGNGNPLSILTWLGGQQSMGSQRVAHD